jgi:hypothetical protein
LLDTSAGKIDMSISSLLKSVTKFLTNYPGFNGAHRDTENEKSAVDPNTTENKGSIEKNPESQPQSNVTDVSKNKEVVHQVDSNKDPSDTKKESALSEVKNYVQDTPQNTAIDVNNEALIEKPVETTPDVFLDVPSLKVQELKLDLEDLNAKVALNAELAGLIKINVGVNAGIKKLDLDLKGVDLKAVLKVRLKQVYAIFDRALKTIDSNPDILKNQELPQSGNVQQIQNEINNDINKKVKNGDTPIETHHSLNKEEQRYRFREDAD